MKYRYLDDPRFKDYSFAVLKGHFKDREEFKEFFEVIEGDKDKNKFLAITSHYKFLVKELECKTEKISNPKEKIRVDYIDGAYKYITILGLIEYLMSNEKYEEFYEWLIKRDNRDKLISINSVEKLEKVYSLYKQSYGSIKKAVKFFTDYLDECDKRDLQKKIKIRKDISSSIGELAKELYQMRSEFLHFDFGEQGNRSIFPMLSDGKHLTVGINKKTKKLVVISLSLADLERFFEHGLLKMFGYPGRQ